MLDVRILGIDRAHAQTSEPRQAVDHLLCQAGAEGIEICVLAVIDEREHGNRIPAGERGGERRTGDRARIAPLENWSVAALRQVDDQLVLPSFLVVVAREPRAEAPCL